MIWQKRNLDVGHLMGSIESKTIDWTSLVHLKKCVYLKEI